MLDPTDRHWYKDAVIYQLHVKAFHDGDGDGIGDFAGLTRKLDYIQRLGATAIWLLPFYPSPLRDDGYDIADYRGVNPAYGSMRDVRRFLRACHERGLRVITELVINHTSDQHPWFQRARAARPGSVARDYYVWSPTDRKYLGTRVIFCDTEKSNWTWDETAGAYYWHRFYSHQPDLNFDNPRVLQEILSVMRYWLDMGVDGLRLDAVPYLKEREGTNNENLPETHDVLKIIRAEIDGAYAGRMLLAEANQWPEDVLPYFGDPAVGGDECHMAFHFPLMPRIYMAVAMEDRHPIADILRQTPEIPADSQWAIFLRNHDELTLEMVTNEERDYLWRFYASDRRMRLNLGIRRRLGPLLDNDRRKVELLNSLLLSMPGTPVIYYGDEIGMGDNVYLGDRDGVRTPMQWSPDRNGGFSQVDPARLYLPAIQDPIYGFQAVNVEAQERTPSSLLHWMRRMIATRQRTRVFGRGTLQLLYPSNRRILAYLRRWPGEGGGEEVVLCVANLSRAAQAVELDLREWKGRVPVELLGRTAFPPVGELPYLLTLEAYGFLWFELAVEVEAPDWRRDPEPSAMELLTLVFREGWESVVRGGMLATLARESLPAFLDRQRWFGAKDHRISSAAVERTAVVPSKEGDLLLMEVRVELDGDAKPRHYLLPLDADWSPAGAPAVVASGVVARARRMGRSGTVHDAAVMPAFVRSLLAAARDGAVFPASRGIVRFTGSERLNGIDPDSLEVQRSGGEQSNTSAVAGDVAMVKTLRQLQRGHHPEVEMSRYLTDVAGFDGTPAFLGAAEFVDEDGTSTALAVITAFVRNQGDGRSTMLAHLMREIDDIRLGIDRLRDAASGGEAPFAFATELAASLGRRTAGMHRALAQANGDPAFDPEPLTEDDVAGWRRRVAREIEDGCAALEDTLPRLTGDTAALAARLLDGCEAARAFVSRPIEVPEGLIRTRIHGDYHLGQVLSVKNDWMIIDFEGPPTRPPELRRAKTSPLVDVAGMLRSWDYVVAAAVDAIRSGSGEAAMAARQIEVARAWQSAVERAFLDAYRESIDGCPVWPASGGAGEAMLALFLFEKAFYEIAYEAANRPGWLGIPLRGVLDMLEQEIA